MTKPEAEAMLRQITDKAMQEVVIVQDSDAAQAIAVRPPSPELLWQSWCAHDSDNTGWVNYDEARAVSHP
jgi:hypothetical protein